MNLHIADKLTLPPDAATQTFAILAKRGVGKTYLASVMAEEMLKADQPIIAIDPTGAWWGLRSKFPVVILGGEHADVPLESSAGEVVARAIVENRFPAVVDLSLFRKGQMIRFMVDFAETLYRLNRAAVHLFVDEADAVAPQAKVYGGEENRMLGAMEDLVRRGRKRGIGCTLITQRPAVLNKNVLTQCENLFTMRLVHPKDIDALKEWVNVHAEPELAKEMIGSLPSLPIGTAWFWSPGWMNQFKRVAIRERETFDSGATPKPGEKARRPRSLAEIDMKSLGESIRATVEKAKADDPKELKRQIAELQKQKKQLEERPAAKPEKVEVPALGGKEIDRLEKLSHSLRESLKTMTEALGKIEASLAAVSRPGIRNGAVLPPERKPVLSRAPTHSPPRITPPASAEGVKIGKSEMNVLRALYWMKDDAEINQAKLAFMAGYSPTASTVGVCLSNLRKAGWIEGFILTAIGLAAIPSNVEAKPTGPELREWIRGKIGLTENKILDVLMDEPGRRFSNDELAELTGYSPTASTIGVALSHLRKFEAIEGGGRSGGVKAADVFFEFE